jgi:hypothetical protein
MAVELEVGTVHLDVRFTGWDRVWALRGGARAAIANVTGVHVDDRRDALSTLGFRLWGSWVPGVLAAGLFRTKGGGRQLWFIRRAPRFLVVDLEREKWDRLVLEVPDPMGSAAWIEAAAKRT